MIRRLTLPLLLLYAVLTAYAVLRPALGLPHPVALTPILTLLAFTFAVLHSSRRLGWRRALLLLALTFGIALLFESVGVATGLIYGPYHYTDRLGPKFLGLVPYLIPVAWFMMMYPSFLIAGWLLPTNLPAWMRTLIWASLGGLVMTAWDLAMDPMMVQAGHWTWEVEGTYFGVPVQNYWGWWLTVFTTFLIYLLLTRQSSEVIALFAPEHSSYDRQAVLSYLITALGNGVAAWQMGLTGPALVGLFAMLPWLLLVWFRLAARPSAAGLKTTWF